MLRRRRRRRRLVQGNTVARPQRASERDRDAPRALERSRGSASRAFLQKRERPEREKGRGGIRKCCSFFFVVCSSSFDTGSVVSSERRRRRRREIFTTFFFFLTAERRNRRLSLSLRFSKNSCSRCAPPLSPSIPWQANERARAPEAPEARGGGRAAAAGKFSCLFFFFFFSTPLSYTRRFLPLLSIKKPKRTKNQLSLSPRCSFS